MRAAGMDIHRETPATITPNKRFFHHTPQEPKNKKSQRLNIRNPPTVTPILDDAEVKRRTGFPTQQHLLLYIFIICNGDINIMTENRTVLTWYKTWFMYF